MGAPFRQARASCYSLSFTNFQEDVTGPRHTSPNRQPIMQRVQEGLGAADIGIGVEDEATETQPATPQLLDFHALDVATLQQIKVDNTRKIACLQAENKQITTVIERKDGGDARGRTKAAREGPLRAALP